MTPTHYKMFLPAVERNLKKAIKKDDIYRFDV